MMEHSSKSEGHEIMDVFIIGIYNFSHKLSFSQNLAKQMYEN